jgi:cytochrome d ubiquinol oxidase subunit I
MEGHWRNEPGAGVPLILFGIPDMEKEETRYAIEIPRLGSLILTHSLDGQFKGLSEFEARDRPNSLVLFWSFRIMVGLGMLMLILGLVGLLLRWKRRFFDQRLFLRSATFMGPSGLIALLAGWYTTEIGRQPWVVYGIMRTEDAVSHHSALALSVTLAVFVVVYLTVFGLGISYMLKLVGKGPVIGQPLEPTLGGKTMRPARPLSAAPDDIDPIPG